MKRKILTGSLLIFFSVNLLAQDCKYKVQEVDKFTGIQELETEPISLLDKLKSETIKIKKIGMILGKKDSDRFFTLSFTIAVSGKGIPIFATTGQTQNMLICLLDNNAKVELPMVNMTSDFIKDKIITHFKISEEDYALLLQHNITDIRAMASINSFDFKVEDGIETKGHFMCIK